MKRIAVIGSGISGLSAAWALKKAADVTLFEKRTRLGGHSHTVTVEYPNIGQIPVDVGFIVYNAHNYPNLIALLDALNVETQVSDMSFAVSDPGGYEWASTAKGFFAQKRNLFSPRFHSFWRTILRFNNVARRDISENRIGHASLGTWLNEHGFDETFRRNYILPMGAAIWSTPEDRLLDYPALSFFQFLDNHKLMHKDRPKWRTVAGGSQSYVQAIEAQLGKRIRLGTGVTRIAKFGNKVRLSLSSGQEEIFDDVILATHSDQAAEMLDLSFDNRKFTLGAIQYRPNQIYLHRDERLMPRKKAAWASWNVLKQDSGDICLTYWMNRLQSIDQRAPLFVTLNPDTPPRDDLIFKSFSFDHPQFDGAAEAAVRTLKRQQGEDGLWLAGAWMGSGFHEDGLKSGLSAALSLGGSVPWQAQNIDLVTSAATPVEETETNIQAVR